MESTKRQSAMTPYEQSIRDAKAFIIGELGCIPEVRELMFYIDRLEADNAKLRQQNSDYGWMVNPDRMGS